MDKRNNTQEAIVETDSLVAVQAIRSNSSLLSYFGRVIEDCKRLLEELKGWKVALVFVKRSANSVAHYLARAGYSLADRTWRLSNAQPEFIDVLMNDLNE